MSKNVYGFYSQDLTVGNVGTGKIKKYVNRILNDLKKWILDVYLHIVISLKINKYLDQIH